MKIYVGGSLENVPRDKELCSRFVVALGQAIVEQGHTLLNGCCSSLDKVIAAAAQKWLLKNSGDPHERIRSYCLKDASPIHNIGTISYSELSDWSMSHAELKPPEQIREAHVTIFVAGGDGTFWARNWAHYARKPFIVGIPRFGGAGESVYHQELARLTAKSPELASEYENLNRLVLGNFEAYAKAAVEGAARLAVPRSVFAVMSFKPEFDPIYDCYQEACAGYGFKAERTDDPNDPEASERILPRIVMGIRQSGIVVVDVTENSPNVFYELGFAQALGKHVVVTAKEGSKVPFDIADVPILYWKEPEDLQTKLKRRLHGIKHQYGI